MKLGCNFPMGPLELTDFVGVDVMLATMTGLYNGYKIMDSRTANIDRVHCLKIWLKRGKDSINIICNKGEQNEKLGKGI